MSKINRQPHDISILDNHDFLKDKKTTLTRSNTSKNGLRSVILKITKLVSIFVAALLIQVWSKVIAYFMDVIPPLLLRECAYCHYKLCDHVGIVRSSTELLATCWRMH